MTNGTPTAARKRIDLALQGGGSHGALTWGVLDRLLEDDRLEIDAISGTSAGAMNAVMLADGLHRNGRDGAREALRDFWQAVSRLSRFSPLRRTFWDRLVGNDSLDHSPGYLFMEGLTRLVDPARLNPLGINPLRDLIREQVDFERVNACGQVKVFVNATNVRTGRATIFRQPHLSLDTLMASACLPTLFPAVEIDGEAYWDGGYSGNPALYPLVDNRGCSDLVVVQVNPLVRRQLPGSAREIINRVNEITFNSSLIKELRSIQLLQRLIEVEGLELERVRAMRLHLIHAEQDVQELSASSKMNAEWEFISRLHDQGRAWAERWLDANFDALGRHSSFDLDAVFDDTFSPLTYPDDACPDAAKPDDDEHGDRRQA
ncbi:patatin [Halomonas sp. ND22Bw]|uniref:patatin-like phospholipase family protein n=1 Tax=Halomonas sp. ND22Bw TaxID=2054178 RepID=UPI000D0B7A2B|nr:patatin [Halomonas sp. ND22Bw]